MTPAEKRFWDRVMRRVARLSPQVAKDIEAAFDELRANLSGREISALVAAGDVEAVLALALSQTQLDTAFQPATNTLREAVTQSAMLTAKDAPKIVGMFNFLDPRTIDAVRQMETRSLGVLKDDVRAVVRQAVENGLVTGASPSTTARTIREAVGLAPNQLEAVRNYERALRGDKSAGNPLTRELRDRRFDSAVKKGALTDEQIAKMTQRYRERFIAFNAETNARTATVDAMRLGQRLSWEQAVQRGDVDGGTLWKRWVTVMDGRERPEHAEANGIEVPFDQVFPVDGGVMVPGESTWNCRCSAIYFTKRAK